MFGNVFSNSVFPMFLEDCETANENVWVINCLGIGI